tara:strand:+ start:190 stop:489 length:300 start_codon:yes stop_codon:yes gene_type:complete
MDSHAQQEIRDYAIPMFEMVKPHFPIATEAFEDYILDSVTFSRLEKNALEYVFNHFPLQQHSSGYCDNILSYIDRISQSEDIDFKMSKREWKELKEKLK